MLQLTIRGYNAGAANVARTIRCYTEEVTAIGGIVKRRYLQRVHEEGRQQSDSTLFTDICYAQWQMIDYCDMIAEALIRYEKSRGGNPQTGSGNDEQLRKQVHEIFRDKYEALKEG